MAHRILAERLVKTELKRTEARRQRHLEIVRDDLIALEVARFFEGTDNPDQEVNPDQEPLL